MKKLKPWLVGLVIVAGAYLGLVALGQIQDTYDLRGLWVAKTTPTTCPSGFQQITVGSDAIDINPRMCYMEWGVESHGGNVDLFDAHGQYIRTVGRWGGKYNEFFRYVRVEWYGNKQFATFCYRVRC